MDTVLFICTGNYYRSRFAEALFNHHAEQRGLACRAFSRGLAIHALPPEFVLSPDTKRHLTLRNVDLRHTAPGRAPLREEDLAASALAVALKDAEHRPMVRRQFPHWENRIVYWDVSDQPEVEPDDGLAAIEQEVLRLIAAMEEPPNAR